MDSTGALATTPPGGSPLKDFKLRWLNWSDLCNKKNILDDVWRMFWRARMKHQEAIAIVEEKGDCVEMMYSK